MSIDLSTSSVLEVDQLETILFAKSTPLRVVNHVSFLLHAGKTTALVGESGSGKSMTALSLLGVLPEEVEARLTGSVYYKGQNLLQLREKEMRRLRGNRIAMIFQNPSSSLNPVYTIGDQLKEVLFCHTDLKEEEATAQATNCLEDVGLSDPEKILSMYPHQLSGGMLQRVMIAMALLLKPDILIADEPTTALDVTIQAQVLDLLKHLQQKHHMALLIITHDLGVVAEIADEVLVMYATEVVEQGSVEEIFASPSHPYTQALLASRPSLSLANEGFKPIEGQVPPINHIPPGCPFHPRCPYKMDKCIEGGVPFFASSPTQKAKCWLLET